jgi:hypothetical protein
MIVSESIFTNGRVVIAMADIQHIETVYRKVEDEIISCGCHVITRHTKYSFEMDCWENPLYLGEDEKQKFLQAWCRFRHEGEGS